MFSINDKSRLSMTRVTLPFDGWEGGWGGGGANIDSDLPNF